MTFIIREIFTGGRVEIIGEAPTFGEAFHSIPGDPIAWEEDADHPQHFDIMTKAHGMGSLRQFIIEPKKPAL